MESESPTLPNNRDKKTNIDPVVSHNETKASNSSKTYKKRLRLPSWIVYMCTRNSFTF